MRNEKNTTIFLLNINLVAYSRSIGDVIGMGMKLTPENILFGHRLKADVLKCDPQDFVDKVVDISQKLWIMPDWLMAVMELETAGTFDPSITNSLGYTGLIQFGQAAANEVGTTQNRLRAMDGCTQLSFVYSYLQKFTGEMKSLHDVYLAVFFPVAIGKPLGWVIQARGISAETVARWNPLFEINKDGIVQVWEVKKKLLDRIPNNWKWIV